MNRRISSIAIASLCLLLVPVQSVFGQVDFTDFVCLGDSLSNNDLLGLAYGNPQELYGADPAEAVFNKAARSGDQLWSFAVAGSEGDEFFYQMLFYYIFLQWDLQDPATLFNFEIGGNDVLNNIGLFAASPPGADPAADAIIDNVIGAMWGSFYWLSSVNPEARFILWTVPDLTLSPRVMVRGYSPAQEANIREHLQRLNNHIWWLTWSQQVVVADVYGQLQQIAAHPPILYGHQLVGPPAYGGFHYLFADSIHPTAVGNAMIANNIIALINFRWNDNIPYYSESELADLARIPH
jgi:hypothetical protein